MTLGTLPLRSEHGPAVEVRGLVKEFEKGRRTIWQRLAPKLTNAKLHRVRVYENHDLFVDFYGEE